MESLIRRGFAVIVFASVMDYRSQLSQVYEACQNEQVVASCVVLVIHHFVMSDSCFALVCLDVVRACDKRCCCADTEHA